MFSMTFVSNRDHFVDSFSSGLWKFRGILIRNEKIETGILHKYFMIKADEKEHCVMINDVVKCLQNCRISSELIILRNW